MRVLAAIALAALAASAEPKGDAVVYSDGRQPLPLASVIRDGVIYHRIDEIAAGLSGHISWIPSRRRAAIIAGADSIALTVDSRFVVVNGRPICLDHPIAYSDGAILAPESFVRAVPSLLTSVRAAWVDSLGQLAVEGAPCDVFLLRAVTEEASVRLEIAVPSYSTWALSPFNGDSASLVIGGATVCASDFESLLTDSSRVSVAARQEPGRVVLVLRRALPSIEAVCRAAGGSLTLELGEYADARSIPRPVRRIVIDAGHGGADMGARSRDGVREKDVTLALARLLTERLKDHGHDLEVLLSRSADDVIPASVRVQRANAAEADLFVSLHCNWSFDRSSSGPQVSFLAPSPTGGARGVRTREGVALAADGYRFTEGTESAPLGQRMAAWLEVHDPWIPASQALARHVTDALITAGLVATPPRQLSLEILVGLDMPGIVVEVGYLSNPVDARDLVTLEHLRTLAEALAKGIIICVDSSRRGVWP